MPRTWATLAGWHMFVTIFLYGPLQARRLIDQDSTQVYRPIVKACHENCTVLGNCNIEEGRCECPFGMTGPSCMDYLFPACRQFTYPGAPVFYGLMVPKNCKCYEQFRKIFCLNERDLSMCSHLTTLVVPELRCFLKKGVPDAEQLSVLPEKNDTSYEWFKGELEYEGNVARGRLDPMPTPKQYGGQLGRPIVPLSRCQSRNYCNEGRGFCTALFGDDIHNCACHIGYSGSDCNTPVQSLCINACSDRGQCVAGFCHCQPGFFGLDCSRTSAFEPAVSPPPPPPRDKLRVYVYELPSHINALMEAQDGDTYTPALYQADLVFTSALLRDSTTRTPNPWEANAFFIPTLLYHVIGNLGSATVPLTRVVAWIRQAFPFFDRSGGRDHFVVLPQDRGACLLGDTPELQNIIKLVHYGLQEANISWFGPVPNRQYGCFNLTKDIVLPPFITNNEVMHAREVYSSGSWNYTTLPEPGPHDEAPQPSPAPLGQGRYHTHIHDVRRKEVLFYFSGSVRPHEPDYSHGVRQALAALLAANTTDTTGVVFLDRADSGAEYFRKMRRSKFCLAPSGHGWGIRLVQAMLHACVPVILQDNVWQAFEDVLPYGDFSLRLSSAQLPQLLDTLRGVSGERLREMRGAMAQHWPAFVWQPQHGGRAYEYTLQSLWLRLQNHWEGRF